MNTYNINDINFINSNIYKEFIKNNPVKGYLRIRAYSANEAIPIEGLNIEVSKILDDNKIIFYEGKTNESGVTEDIALPAPTINPDNLDVPHYTTYDIEANCPTRNIKKSYQVNIYEDIHVAQNINVSPMMDSEGVFKWQ